jgi:hypothetical protein
MWKSRTKEDLVIEVWEALDCESIGARELSAIEKEVAAHLGPNAVDMPMRTARILADEGAALRHAEILALDVSRRTDDPFAQFFKTIFTDTGLDETLASIRRVDELRRRLETEGDKELLRQLRSTALDAKARCLSVAERGLDGRISDEAAESARWITIWLESPDIFENWVGLRRASEDFIRRFPDADRTPPVDPVF